MKYEDVKTWDDFEEYVKSLGSFYKAEEDKCERVAKAVSAAMDALQEIHMGMEIFDLDEMPEHTETLEEEKVLAVV